MTHAQPAGVLNAFHSNESFLLFHRYVCEEDWPEPEYNYYYSIALLVLQFVIPLVVLVFTYTRIAFAVWGKKPPGEAENSRDQRMAKSKRKVINACMYEELNQSNTLLFTICIDSHIDWLCFWFLS